jgi:hypothetical protein
MKPELIALDRAAALEGLGLDAYRKRLQRQRIIRLPDPEDKRRCLIRVADLSAGARQQHYKEQAQDALAPLGPEPPEDLAQAAPRNESLQLLPFAPPTSTERALRDAAPPAIPSRHRAYIERWSGIIGDCANGTWKKYRGKLFEGFAINSARDFVRALAHLHDLGVSTIYAKLGAFRQVERDPAIPPDRKMAEFWARILPQPRPGRSGHSFFHERENDWMGPKLESFYLTQAKLSIKRAHELLLRDIESKQRAHGIGHLYQRPTLHQSRIYLSKLDTATLTLARQGDKAYSDRCAPYLSRRNNLSSNQLWVADQKLFDVRLRDGGERLGRVWGVNVLDVSSWRWLGGAVGPYLSADLVMEAYARALARAGVPRAVHMDLGKEFIGKRFLGGVFKISGETLFGEAAGLWHRLGVRVVKAIGRNAQSKTIERWHLEVDRWTRDYLPGWCGSNPDERPEILAAQEAEHAAWLSGRAPRSPLLRVSDFIGRFFEWSEVKWNHRRHSEKSKYLPGMTPMEAWNTRLPAEGLQRLTPDQVDHYTAERRFLKVARGGQVNLTFYGHTVEYVAADLFSLQGEEVEVLVPRDNPRVVTVVYPVAGGTASCEAALKPQHEWLPEDREELRLALRCRAAAKRALLRGIEAGRALDEAASPLELIEAAPARSFGAPKRGLPPKREPPRFANERAAAVLAILEEEERAEP